jgi:hypothetical protein
VKWPRFRLSLEPDGRPISGQRLLFSVVLGVAAAALAAAPDFLRDEAYGWPALIAFALLTMATSAGFAVIFNRYRPIPDPADVRAAQTRRLLFNAARPIPQKRQAPVLSEFRGRGQELTHWTNEHTRLRRTRKDPAVRLLSPVVLAMHGPPGVGKSMLTQALARRLADGYDGYFIVSFGASGTARGPADIARDLLLQLGWPEVDMPTETEDRVATLRSLTRNKSMLFLFDAVRDHDQVRQLMPSEPRCAVILSSRRELGSSLGIPPRPPIGATSLADSLEILTAISNVDWTRNAETAVDIVDLCGRLPLAVRSVAERVRDGEGMRFVAALLRSPGGRLRALDYGGRSVRDRIRSEYERLTVRQREALKLLATLDSDTFVPWVLRPLLALAHHESTTFVAGLAAAQFLEEVGLDGTGQARYRLHPLMRVYAAQAGPPVDTQAAAVRFNDAYIDLIDDTLVEYDPTYERIRTGDRHWRSDHSRIAEKIARTLDHLLPYEYLNLVRIIHAADMTTHAPMIWRIAALLDGRVPTLAHKVRPVEEWIARVQAAFERGTEAAKQCQSPEGEVRVRLGYAQFLIAIERYHEAIAELTATSDLLASVPDPDTAARLRLRLLRARAWAPVQRGAYIEAYRILGEADALIESLPEAMLREPPVQTDVDLLELFNQEAHRLTEGHWWVDRPRRVAASGIVDLRTALARAGEMRRLGHFDDAADELRHVLDKFVDVRSRTAVHSRLAGIFLDEARHRRMTDAEEPRRQRLIRAAVEHAAACVVNFVAVGDVIGQVRARCLLMRTLVMAGNNVAAMQLALEVEAEIRTLENDEATAPYIQPLRGRYARARAEVEVADGREESAWRYLTDAAQIFRDLSDWTSNADTWRILDQLYANRRGLRGVEPV